MHSRPWILLLLHCFVAKLCLYHWHLIESTTGRAEDDITAFSSLKISLNSHHWKFHWSRKARKQFSPAASHFEMQRRTFVTLPHCIRCDSLLKWAVLAKRVSFSFLANFLPIFSAHQRRRALSKWANFWGFWSRPFLLTKVQLWKLPGLELFSMIGSGHSNTFHVQWTLFTPGWSHNSIYGQRKNWDKFPNGRPPTPSPFWEPFIVFC